MIDFIAIILRRKAKVVGLVGTIKSRTPTLKSKPSPPPLSKVSGKSGLVPPGTSKLKTCAESGKCRLQRAGVSHRRGILTRC